MQRYGKGIIFGVVTLLAVTAGEAGSIASAASLEDVVRRVVKENPEILEAAANRRAVDQELRQARGLYLPRVDVEAAAGPEWSLNSTTRARTGRNTSDSAGVWRSRVESRITLNQVLFDGFARDSEVERQAARVDAAAKRVRERSEFIALDLIEAYLDILRYQEHQELAKHNITAHEDHVRNVRERVSAGQRGAGDQHQAQSRLAAAKTIAIEVNRDLEEAEIYYRRLLGEDPVELVKPVVRAEQLPKSVDEVVRMALVNNPSLELAAADMDVSRAEFSAGRAALYPTLNLEISGSRNNRLDGVDEVNHDMSTMLRFKYNLYRGGIDQAKTYEYIERLAETRGRVQGLERAVEEEARQSWSATNTARHRFSVLKEQVVANTQMLSTYQQEFVVGQRDLIDVLDAEHELFTARTRLVTSEYAILFGHSRVLASMGELLASMNIQSVADASADMRKKYDVTPDSRGQGDIPDDQKNPN